MATVDTRLFTDLAGGREGRDPSSLIGLEGNQRWDLSYGRLWISQDTHGSWEQKWLSGRKDVAVTFIFGIGGSVLEICCYTVKALIFGPFSFLYFKVEASFFAILLSLVSSRVSGYYYVRLLYVHNEQHMTRKLSMHIGIT